MSDAVTHDHPTPRDYWAIAGIGTRVGDVVAVHVIARPHIGVDMTIPLGRTPEPAE